MTDQTTLREPLPSVLMTGYMEIKLADKIDKYTKRMLRCLEQGIKDINEELGYEAVQRLDAAEFTESVYELQAAKARMQQAHKIMSDKLQDLGFRKVVSQDFIDADLGGRVR